MSESSSEEVPTVTEESGRALVKSDAPETEAAERLTQILERQGVRVDPAKAQIVLQQVTTEIVKSHVGPLPAVEDFAGYEEICPGSAREILDMAVRQQKHRHHMEKYSAGTEFWLPAIGIGAAVTLVAAMLGAGVYLAMSGHENLAIGVLSGTGIVTVAGAFLQRSKTEEAPPPPPRSGRLTRRERRERASQARKNMINR
ncbi:DUF2335 domain-containing protein [Bradyrhizobium sp. 33ap4]|uniref:DUF2335 domain-containing protein n=1 Tax=Bradyrhizobium sp. 33ap4 TaxID=3061630 RepID=UPI00292EE8F1|nr:DUF2335 domain-containing protein [Bradyrhizobium sp. 33ap4]